MFKECVDDEKCCATCNHWYFEETYDDITGELIYKYKGNYFEDRKNKNFGAQLDIFG